MTESNKNSTPIKLFNDELEVIDRLNSLEMERIIIENTEDINAKLNRQTQAFEISLDSFFQDKDEDNLNFSFSLGQKEYEVLKTGKYSKGTKAKIDSNVEFISTIELCTFQSRDFDSLNQFKMFVTVGINEIKTFLDDFETISYRRNGIEYFNDCLKININNNIFNLTQIKHNGKGYLIFESNRENSLKGFIDACFSIKQAVGFITALMVGGEMFVFDSQKELYYSNFSRPSLKGLYRPIVSNPYSRIEIERSIACLYYEKLNKITLENLSKLASKIHSEERFSAILLLVLESTSLKSLLVMPSAFAVVIELFSKSFNDDEHGLETPIKDSAIKNELIENLHQVIDQYNDRIDENSILKLKRRINEINKPVNKKHLTNNEKLTLPFEKLGIKLSLHDIHIIEHRNDLLHGNILLEINSKNSNHYLAYVAAKLFTLISKLVLKSIGYKGYVYNQGKYLEKYIDIKTDEEYFELI